MITRSSTVIFRRKIEKKKIHAVSFSQFNFLLIRNDILIESDIISDCTFLSIHACAFFFQLIMYIPSLSLILSLCFTAYIGHSMWTMAKLFIAPECQNRMNCIHSFLNSHSKLQVSDFTMVINSV